MLVGIMGGGSYLHAGLHHIGAAVTFMLVIMEERQLPSCWSASWRGGSYLHVGLHHGGVVEHIRDRDGRHGVEVFITQDEDVRDVRVAHS